MESQLHPVEDNDVRVETQRSGLKEVLPAGKQQRGVFGQLQLLRYCRVDVDEEESRAVCRVVEEPLGRVRVNQEVVPLPALQPLQYPQVQHAGAHQVMEGNSKPVAGVGLKARLVQQRIASAVEAVVGEPGHTTSRKPPQRVGIPHHAPPAIRHATSPAVPRGGRFTCPHCCLRGEREGDFHSRSRLLPRGLQERLVEQLGGESCVASVAHVAVKGEGVQDPPASSQKSPRKIHVGMLSRPNQQRAGAGDTGRGRAVTAREEQLEDLCEEEVVSCQNLRSYR
eukprot:765394-Hanusia_phi.AAC.3